MTPTPIVALDFPDAGSAMTLVKTLDEKCRFYKVGSELFAAEGPEVIQWLRDTGCEIFLDLKFHDIPNTVAGSLRRVAAMGVRLATVHASGGAAMVQAAVDAAGDACSVLAVTVLTSLDARAVGQAWGRENPDVETEVLRLADLARAAGAHGVVCGGHEARAIRSRFGPDFRILVPGIRLEGDSPGDQSRVVTPDAAAAAGADYLVLGRAVTTAPSPREAMDRVNQALGNDGSSRPRSG